MSGSVNRAIIMGNLGRDPEIKSLASGDRIATLSLATEETWTDKRSGERMKKSEWHRVVIFNQALVGVVEKYVKKGSKLHVIGELRTRKWQGRDGEDRLTTEIVLPNFGGELTIVSSPKREQGDGESRAPSGTDQRGNPRHDDLNDAIPF